MSDSNARGEAGDAEGDAEVRGVVVRDEETPLLFDGARRRDRQRVREDDEGSVSSKRSVGGMWTPPRGFYWIETAIFLNVFLAGLDATITASTYTLISSTFNSFTTASWLTTSYLVTSTAFQPLYGRFSDLLGRRVCFLFSTVCFLIGVVGCAASQDVVSFCIMRALTGIGGGGLITMATVVNSDMIPFRERGLYQAAQNVLHGFGSICGASLGGVIADTVGWRYAFALQAPVSLMALFLGLKVLKDPLEGPGSRMKDSWKQVWQKVDFTGAILLTVALSVQLVGLSLGGNELPWKHPIVIAALVLSFVLLGAFVLVEYRTKAIPVLPLRMFKGVGPIATHIANVNVGMAAYGFLFMVPLFFQVVKGESAAKAGGRLIVPSVAQPLGGVVAGYVMHRFGKLSVLTRCAAATMTLGNALITSFRFQDDKWKYVVYLFPANFGVGIVYPSILFTLIASFDHNDHAVSASTVYLVRSMGWVYGVAITSAITQNFLKVRLPAALHGIPDKTRIIEDIRHSVQAIDSLPADVQVKARLVYYDGIRIAFAATTAFTIMAFVAAFFTKGRGLQRRGE